MSTKDPEFPLYSVVYEYDTGEGTKVQTTSLMRPWLFKVDPGAEEVERQARAVWPTIRFRETNGRDCRLLGVNVEHKGDVPWALGWFTHQTFRAGRTDEELRESFQRFVDLHAYYQDDSDAWKRPGYHCLMGAQDRWRWKPFCECDNCKRDDVAMIAH